MSSNSDLYLICEKKIQVAALQNEKLERGDVNGHLWCAICNLENDEPELGGPIRYNALNGMTIYNSIISHRITDENKYIVKNLMSQGNDIFIFIRGGYEKVSILKIY